jgi:DNA-binding NtrC family response regulator
MIDAARREMICKALADAQGNRTEAATLLGLHKPHLFRLNEGARYQLKDFCYSW